MLNDIYIAVADKIIQLDYKNHIVSIKEMLSFVL